MNTYMPHGMCFNWDPTMLSYHVLSDGATFLAYTAIAISLFLVRRVVANAEVIPRWALGAFAVFIAACGLTHLFSIIVLWWPIYVWEGHVKFVCAIASVTTAATIAAMAYDVLKGRGAAARIPIEDGS
jgi:hypothetical protein